MKEPLSELAKKISRKAVLLAIAMILIYMLVITPTAITIGIWKVIAIISCLSLTGTFLQFYLDLREEKRKDKQSET